MLPLLTLLTLLFSIVVPAANAALLESRVFPALQEDAAKEPGRKFRVIITRQRANVRVSETAVRAAGGRFLRQLPHDAFVAELPGQVIAELGRSPGVKYIAPDARIRKTCGECGAIDPSKLATLYPNASGAASLWPATTNGAGWTGKGVGVAVLDTGINAARLDWNGATGQSRIVRAPIFSSGDIKWEDGHGHGTHVAGIIGANSWHRTKNTVKGKYIGVAPEATLIDVKVSDDRGTSYVSDVVIAIDWVIANRALYNIRVMNLSLVSSVAESYKTSTLAAAVERAWFNGILVVVAAGNAGPDTLHFPPANDPFVVTVGASDPMATPANHDDTIAPWSSYGITQDGISKPDIVATGRYVTAPLSSASSTLGRSMPARIVDGSYIWLSGTSMAAPVVAGIGALAFQAHPEWTNDQVKWLLMQTATPLGTTAGSSFTPLPGSGVGAVNAAAVVNYSATPQGANQGLSISEQLLGPGGVTIYLDSSWSSSSWSSSSWSSANWSSANWSSANWSSANWSSANWSSANWSSANWSSANWSSSTNAVACDSSCDGTGEESMPSGTLIPFEDPALELGLPVEQPVLVP